MDLRKNSVRIREEKKKKTKKDKKKYQADELDCETKSAAKLNRTFQRMFLELSSGNEDKSPGIH